MEGVKGKAGVDPAWSDCKLLNHIAAGFVSAYGLTALANISFRVFLFFASFALANLLRGVTDISN
jgi:hypothetical protein